jgi:hypothetical protein
MGTFRNADIIEWYRNGAPVSNSNTRKLKLTALGKYVVSGISSSQCKTVSDTVTITVLENEAKQECERIRVFPNPASDALNIEGLDYGQEYELNLINSIGQTVLSTKINESNAKIDVSNLSSGMYQLVLKDARSVRVQKLLIEN